MNFGMLESYGEILEGNFTDSIELSGDILNYSSEALAYSSEAAASTSGLGLVASTGFTLVSGYLITEIYLQDKFRDIDDYEK